MAPGSNPRGNDLFNALGHPMRRRILREMLDGDGEVSPRELAATLTEQLSALSYHVRVLAECRAIELVRTEQIRGSTQHFYRPVVKAPWAITALETGEAPPRRGGSRGGREGLRARLMGAIVKAEGQIHTTREEDRIFEAAVLQQVLAIHPNPVTLTELVDEIAGKGCDFAQRDAIERAVHSLAGCGLLHRSGALVLPSRAALRFEQLLGE